MTDAKQEAFLVRPSGKVEIIAPVQKDKKINELPACKYVTLVHRCCYVSEEGYEEELKPNIVASEILNVLGGHVLLLGNALFVKDRKSDGSLVMLSAKKCEAIRKAIAYCKQNDDVQNVLKQL